MGLISRVSSRTYRNGMLKAALKISHSFVRPVHTFHRYNNLFSSFSTHRDSLLIRTMSTIYVCESSTTSAPDGTENAPFKSVQDYLLTVDAKIPKDAKILVVNQEKGDNAEKWVEIAKARSKKEIKAAQTTLKKKAAADAKAAKIAADAAQREKNLE